MTLIDGGTPCDHAHAIDSWSAAIERGADTVEKLRGSAAKHLAWERGSEEGCGRVSETSGVFMKLLLVVLNYPHAGHPSSGIFNERSAIALRACCDDVVVLAPRPYVPPGFANRVPRWEIYAQIPRHETRNGIMIVRPAYLQIPKLRAALPVERSGYIFSRRLAKRLHKENHFDAILAFDLAAGGIAWRLSRCLGIPAFGWAQGSDVRVSMSTSAGCAVTRTLRELDGVFYQSRELRDKGMELLGPSLSETQRQRQVVLSRGVVAPPVLARSDLRQRIRAELGIANEETFVLTIARVCREKGVYELAEAIAFAAREVPRIRCAVLGSLPALDETAEVRAWIGRRGFEELMMLLPACRPDKVWEYLCAADIFAFASYREGMPNSLLEAMAMGIPVVAFAIPPVVDIDAGTGAVALVPPFEVDLLAKAIVKMATASPAVRATITRAAVARTTSGFSIESNMREAARRIAEVANLKKPGRRT
jgi:teichuronic acid biosynthesis glycosyltransferase TuaC